MRNSDPKSIEQLFDEIAPSYDKLNDLLSLGLHRIWKRQLLGWLKPTQGESWLDLCCGTGDLALVLAGRVRPSGHVLGLDSSSEQLSLAKKRSNKKPSLNISWLQADALNTGLSSDCFDGAVMAYGLRNLSNPTLGLKEMQRILKPGARAGILDFNRLLNDSFAAKFQKLYLRNFVVPIASTLGLRDQYAYLEESLKEFSDGQEQEKMALEVGFSEAVHLKLAFGQMGVLLLKN
ncbi:bifunctional demethylmenaquinone methyltransferase/2-methoxy-6-polyprenyl-1,4-benzoquinol methylase UbiE [Prochlorococcus sp. MIT 1300]|uniref:bifunctional demethylmenaquinone methyltransferase/2-methoxy-6-polyprenyl-1,4-benzoquinol methylase UbiE n=1 Tax=Prochlorococcus sp. MIT 1300 TaxID=3096218 RepID=UPI002A748261|nr:bifunctional demethylmenaquinone methyltransferase/2-methoxy-6-polyprenyl-1,4-benzoquinol methylase UbiE [Prochlorococcus sp. MIT 1300]